MNQQEPTLAIIQPPKEAANDTGEKFHLRQYPPTDGSYQYIPFDWARVMEEEGVKVRP